MIRVVYLISKKFINAEGCSINFYHFEDTVGSGYVWQGKWRLIWSSGLVPPRWDEADYILLKDFQGDSYVFNVVSNPNGWVLIDRDNRIVPLDILKVIFAEVMGRTVHIRYLPFFEPEVRGLVSFFSKVKDEHLNIRLCLLTDLSKLEKSFKIGFLPTELTKARARILEKEEGGQNEHNNKSKVGS
jgi:hypothetical protein